MPEAVNLTGLLSSLGSGAGAVVSSLGNASTVTIQTQLTPPVTFSPNAGGQPEASGPGSGFPSLLNPLAWLKPQITLNVAGQTVTTAPYGTPDGNYLPRLVTLGAGLAGATLFAVGARGTAKKAFLVAGVALVLSFLPNMLPQRDA